MKQRPIFRLISDHGGTVNIVAMPAMQVDAFLAKLKEPKQMAYVRCKILKVAVPVVITKHPK